MRDSDRRWVAGCVGVLVAVGLGYASGRFLGWRAVGTLTPLVNLVGVITAVITLFPRVEGTPTLERVGAVILIGYAVVVIIVDPLAFIGDDRNLMTASIWIWPLVIGGVLLTRYGSLLACASCWCLLFGGVAAVTFNLLHDGRGIGFVSQWMD